MSLVTSNFLSKTWQEKRHQLELFIIRVYTFLSPLIQYIEQKQTSAKHVQHANIHDSRTSIFFSVSDFRIIFTFLSLNFEPTLLVLLGKITETHSLDCFHLCLLIFGFRFIHYALFPSWASVPFSDFWLSYYWNNVLTQLSTLKKPILHCQLIFSEIYFQFFTIWPKTIKKIRKLLIPLENFKRPKLR